MPIQKTKYFIIFKNNSQRGEFCKSYPYTFQSHFQVTTWTSVSRSSDAEKNIGNECFYTQFCFSHTTINVIETQLLVRYESKAATQSQRKLCSKILFSDDKQTQLHSSYSSSVCSTHSIRQQSWYGKVIDIRKNVGKKIQLTIWAVVVMLV